MATERRRNSFTLIEIMVALFLITIGLGTLAIKGPALLRHERFEQAIVQIKEELIFATELMLLSQSDVTLHLSQEKKGMVISYEVESTLLKSRFKPKLNNPILIRGVEKLYFNKKQVREATLVFTINSLTKGQLTFANNGEERSLFLSGFPSFNFTEAQYEVPQGNYPEELFSPT